MWSARLHVGVAAAAAVLSACAAAGSGSSSPDARNVQLLDAAPDAFVRPVDAMVDAAPTMMMTLSENTGSTLGTNAIGCQDFNSQNGNVYFTWQNSYYRVFRLSDFGITDAFHVASVTFGVQRAFAPSGSQMVTAQVGTYTGTPGGSSLVAADISGLTAIPVTMTNGATTETATFPTAPAITGNLIVELDSISGEPPAGGGNPGNIFFIGTNALGESAPSYFSSTGSLTGVPECTGPDGASLTIPTDPSALAGGQTDWLITVTGTY